MLAQYKFVPTVDHTAFHVSLDGNMIRKDIPEATQMIEERERRVKELELAEEAERNRFGRAGCLHEDS